MIGSYSDFLVVFSFNTSTRRVPSSYPRSLHSHNVCVSYVACDLRLAETRVFTSSTIWKSYLRGGQTLLRASPHQQTSTIFLASRLIVPPHRCLRRPISRSASSWLSPWITEILDELSWTLSLRDHRLLCIIRVRIRPSNQCARSVRSTRAHRADECRDVSGISFQLTHDDGMAIAWHIGNGSSSSSRKSL